jgi:hypothetical protein
MRRPRPNRGLSRQEKKNRSQMINLQLREEALRVDVLGEENINETPKGLAGNRRPVQPNSPACSIFTL